MLSKTILIGHVGQDPEIKTLTSGDTMAIFSLATTERWKDKEGEKKEKTEWHRVVCFQDGLVGIIKQYVKKGSKVYVEGQIASRKWTDDQGVERVAYEISVKSRGKIVLLDKQSNSNSPTDDAYEAE